MSFLDVQDLATVAAQTDLWWLIVRWCVEYDTVIEALGLAAVVAVGALLLKRQKIDL